MSDTTNITEEPKEPTHEELKKFQDKMHAFRVEQIPLLKKQLEYERLKAEIEEARYRRVSATVKIAQMTAPPPKDNPEAGQESEKTT